MEHNTLKNGNNKGKPATSFCLQGSDHKTYYGQNLQFP